MASSSANAVPRLEMSSENRLSATHSHTAAVNVYMRNRTPSVKTGGRQIAAMASNPKIPIVAFSVPAAAASVEAASDKMLPTTGSAADTAVFVTRAASASAVPVTTPVRESHAVNATQTPLKSVVQIVFMIFFAVFNISFPTAASATDSAA